MFLTRQQKLGVRCLGSSRIILCKNNLLCGIESTTTIRNYLTRSVGIRTAIQNNNNNNNNNNTKNICFMINTHDNVRNIITTPKSSSSFRFLSSSSNNQNINNNNTNEDMSKEIVLTPGEKLVAVTRLGWYIGLAALAATCAYFVGVELFPSSGSPNSVFSNSLDKVRQDTQIVRRYGDTIKGYGRDHGGHREGRRNFVEHDYYIDSNDNSKRTRVRYNIEGRFGAAYVFAEVSNKMKSGEFVYILVQDKSNGQVHTVIDNRSALVAQQLSGTNTDTMNALSQLLNGTKK